MKGNDHVNEKPTTHELALQIRVSSWVGGRTRLRLVFFDALLVSPAGAYRPSPGIRLFAGVWMGDASDGIYSGPSLSAVSEAPMIERECAEMLWTGASDTAVRLLVGTGLLPNCSNYLRHLPRPFHLMTM